MTFFKALLFPSLLMMAVSSQAACVLPQAPSYRVDASVVDAEDLLYARRRLERYLQASEQFIDCLDTMEKTAQGTGRESDSRRRKRISDYNKVMADTAVAVTAYNTQVAQFKAVE